MTVSAPRPPAAVTPPFSAGAREVLIVGGGIAGVEALIALADLGEHALRVRLVAAHPSFVLRPQLLGRPWGGEPLHIDLERLCRAFGAEFTHAKVSHVDHRAHRIATADGTLLEYDRLLLAPGAHLALPYTGIHVLGFGPLIPSCCSASRASPTPRAPRPVSTPRGPTPTARARASTGPRRRPGTSSGSRRRSSASRRASGIASSPATSSAPATWRPATPTSSAATSAAAATAWRRWSSGRCRRARPTARR